MSQSLVKIYLHIIFSTKNREDLLPKAYLNEIHSYIAGVIKNNGCVPITVGGTSNHVHLLCEMSSNITVAELLRLTKASTSKWVKEKYGENDFAWQGGYAALSVSQSNADAVSHYISNQEQHHRKLSFKDEFLGFLKKYKINYNEEYLWT